MRTGELERCAQSVPGFLGVFAANKLPFRLPTNPNAYPLSFIANTDPSWRPGQHWFCVVFPQANHAIYFDSFGGSPFLTMETHAARLINQAACFLQTSPFPVQCMTGKELLSLSGDGSCGEFCLFVLYKLPDYSYSLKKLFDCEFSPTDCVFNEEKVLAFTKTLL